MAWNKKGTWIITKEVTNIPVSFISRIATQITPVSIIKDTWFWAGFYYQYLNIVPIGLARIEDKINVPLREPSILIPQAFKPNYQLKFHKADWIDSLKLTIYEDSMPINFEPAAPVVNVPNPFASASVSVTVPISATSVSFLPANASRKKLVIANNTNQDLYIDLDATASIADHAIKIPKVSTSGFIANYELENYTGVVSGIWAAPGTGAALIREMVL